MSKPIIITEVILDHHEFSGPAFDAFKDAFKVFGAFMYEDPRAAGSDQYGFIIANQPLTKRQLIAMTKEDGELA